LKVICVAGASTRFLAVPFLKDRIVDDEKECRIGFDPQRLEE
jgi:hypothetical protein